MLHLEKEKISTQLSKSSLQLQRLLELSKKKNTNEITAGSIFCIASNWYFLAVAIGKINVNGTDVFILSSASPFGKLALGMKEGQLFEFNRIKSKISKIL